MFDFACPAVIKGEILDDYLAKGWFRIGSFLHTTDSTSIDDKNEYPVYYLRYKVNEIRLDRKNRKLVSVNGGFTTHCRPLMLNREIDLLFMKYRKGLQFNISSSLLSILGEPTSITFDTKIIEVRDKGRLIAIGIFDTGDVSVENIINIYDHAYCKHSLGKFLMMSIYQYCLKHNFEYFYPGYYFPIHQKLSYKLFLDKGATEVYLPEHDKWIGFLEFERIYTPV